MEYPYKNQAKAKAKVTVDDYIMFSCGTDKTVDSGVVIERNGNSITVLFENDDREDDVLEFDLDSITLYRDKEWEDIE